MPLAHDPGRAGLSPTGTAAPPANATRARSPDPGEGTLLYCGLQGGVAWTTPYGLNLNC